MDLRKSDSGNPSIGGKTTTSAFAPVCVEIGVCVQGLRPVSAPVGPGKPFKEETRTLLVFPHGAVVELAVPLVSDHRVELRRSDLDRRVQCRVACVRPRPNAKALVELEFTEPAKNFWESGKVQPAARESLIPAPTLPPRTPIAAEKPAVEALSLPQKETPPALAAQSLAHDSGSSQGTALAEDVLGIHEAPQRAERRLSLQAAAEAQGRAALAAPRTAAEIGVADSSQRPFGSRYVSPVASLAVEPTRRRRRVRAVVWLGVAAVLVLSVSAVATVYFPSQVFSPLEAELPAPAAPVPPPEAEEKAEPTVTATVTIQPEDAAAQAASQPSDEASRGLSKQVPPEVSGPPAIQAQSKLAKSPPPVRRSILDGPLSAPIVKHAEATPSEEAAPAVEILSGTIPASNPIGGLIGGEPRPLAVAESSVLPPKPSGISGQVRPPRLLKSFPPAYPLVARQRKMEGDVAVEATVDASGTVVKMRVVSGPAFFHQAALDAVRGWKYQPATLNGVTVSADVLVVLKFRIND